MRFGTWNVRSLYRAGSLTAAAGELARYKLDLVGVQEVSWDRWGMVRARDYNYSYGKGKENHQLGTEFFVLRWILRKWGIGVWIGSSWLRIGTGGGHL